MLIDPSVLSADAFHLQKPTVAWHNFRAVKALGYRSFSPRRGAPMQPSQQFRDLFALLPAPYSSAMHRRKYWPGLEGLGNKNRDYKHAIRSVQFALANFALLESANVLKAVSSPGAEITLAMGDTGADKYKALTARSGASRYAAFTLAAIRPLLLQRELAPALIFPLNMRSYFPNVGLQQREHELATGDWLRWTMHFAKWAEIDIAGELPLPPDAMMDDIASQITDNAVDTIKHALDYMVNYNNFVWHKAVNSWIANYGLIKRDLWGNHPGAADGVGRCLRVTEALATKYGPEPSIAAVAIRAARQGLEIETIKGRVTEEKKKRAVRAFQVQNRLDAGARVREQIGEIMRTAFKYRDKSKLAELNEQRSKIAKSKAADWPLTEVQSLEIARLFDAEK